MKERYPNYYGCFKCIAGDCEDTCCAGWEIDIDDDSYAAYMKISGELGKKLRSCIRTYDTDDVHLDTNDGGMPDTGPDHRLYEEIYAGHGFILTDNMRCPFLDENNLCELYRELGESSLCEVCTNTPRNFLEYGGVREISISASCPEAARLIYGSPEPIGFTERETDERTEPADTADEDELLFARFLEKQRSVSIELLQDRSYELNERIQRFLTHSNAVQESINRWETDGEELKLDTVSYDHDSIAENKNEHYLDFLTRMDIYSGLASIGQAWADRITLLYESFVKDPEEGKTNYIRATHGLTDYLDDEGRLYEYEHLLVYYAFLLLNRSIDDYDYHTKARLVVMSYEMNRDMDAAIWFKNGCFLKKDREENARIYAREVEHAEENLADLYEELLFC